MSRVLWIPIWISVSCGLAAVYAGVHVALDALDAWAQRRADQRFILRLRRRWTDHDRAWFGEEM